MNNYYDNDNVQAVFFSQFFVTPCEKYAHDRKYILIPSPLIGETATGYFVIHGVE